LPLIRRSGYRKNPRPMIQPKIARIIPRKIATSF